jgi:hypothetical protein
MTDHDPLAEADTADLAEQRTGVGGGDRATTPLDDPDAPEGDALEQARGTTGGAGAAPATDVDATTPIDADEADALEQRTTVADDDRDEWRGDDGGS